MQGRAILGHGAQRRAALARLRKARQPLLQRCRSVQPQRIAIYRHHLALPAQQKWRHICNLVFQPSEHCS